MDETSPKGGGVASEVDLANYGVVKRWVNGSTAWPWVVGEKGCIASSAYDGAMKRWHIVGGGGVKLGKRKISFKKKVGQAKCCMIAPRKHRASQ